jgi:hypothetical protein
MSRQNLTPVNIPAYPSNPNTPTARAGDMYFNTGTNNMYYYNGTAWQVFASGGSANVPDITNYGFWSS